MNREQAWLREGKAPIEALLSWLVDVPALRVGPPELADAKSGQPPDDSTANDADRHQRLRAEASCWPMKLELHRQTYRFTVPEPVRRLGLLSGEATKGERAEIVMFGCGDILELWRPEDWRRNLRLICGDKWAI